MPRPAIFWVEDNASDVEVMRTAFTIAGVEADFIVAEHGMAAFRYLERIDPYVDAPWPPDLVILDLGLPALTGQVMLTTVRRTPGFERIPVVIFSGSTDETELAACRTHGAAECIRKPLKFGGFLEVVERLRRYLPERSAAPGPDAGGST